MWAERNHQTPVASCVCIRNNNFLERVPNNVRNYIFLFLGWAEKLIIYMCPAVNVLKTKHFLERGHFVGPDLR